MSNATGENANNANLKLIRAGLARFLTKPNFSQGRQYAFKVNNTTASVWVFCIYLMYIILNITLGSKFSELCNILAVFYHYPLTNAGMANIPNIRQHH